MKKIILLIIMLILPFNVKALNIKETKIIGSSIATAGTQLNMNVHIDFKGFDNEENKLGIWVINYEVEFDENDIIIEKIKGGLWDSVLYKENNKYYVQSIINHDNKNLCFNNMLYCNNYLEEITFFIKTNEEKNIDIKIKDITIGLIDTSINKDKYLEEDLNIIKSVNEAVKTVTIKKANMAIKEVVMNYELNKPELGEIILEEETSNNNYIKNIYIKDHKINFDKDTETYELEIVDTINSLDIDVLLEDEKAEYKIKGANNIKNNNNKILIEVTATNGETRVYTINIKKLVTEVVKKKNKFIVPGIICGGIVLIIVIILMIRSYLYDKKLDKALEEM